VNDAGNALERWRAQLNVTTEQDGAAEDDAGPVDGEEVPEVAAAEYEYLAEGESQQRGDTQAMAPATEDQAAVADLPDPGAGVDADETAAQVEPALYTLLCLPIYRVDFVADKRLHGVVLYETQGEGDGRKEGNKIARKYADD